MMQQISEHIGLDEYATRKAKVVLENDVYGVEYIMNDSLVSYRVFPGHSVYMAEDAAENWVTGVMRYDHVTTDY
jgi:hypothetical protein